MNSGSEKGAPPGERGAGVPWAQSVLRRDQMRAYPSPPSTATSDAKIGAGKLGSSSLTERYSRPAPEVFFQAAPNSVLCDAPHKTDYAELSIMRSGGA